MRKYTLTVEFWVDESDEPPDQLQRGSVVALGGAVCKSLGFEGPITLDGVHLIPHPTHKVTLG